MDPSWQPLRNAVHARSGEALKSANSVKAGARSSISLMEESLPLDTIHVRQEYGVSLASRNSIIGGV